MNSWMKGFFRGEQNGFHVRESGVITERVAMTIVLTWDSNELGRWDKRQVWRGGMEELPGLVIGWIWGKTSVP